jgi:2-oxoglutarate-Fe(II)-dependent oxygenase superfamily protein
MSLVFEPAINTNCFPEPPPTICDFTQLNVNNTNHLSVEPFPHVVHHQFIAPEYYAELCGSFPNCPPSSGPTGFSLYWGDEGYTCLLEQQPVWRALFNTFHSQQFIDWGKEQFATVWREAGCKINLEEARYVPYREDRIDKERATLREIEHEPHELWVRMDIHQGQMGYDRGIHVDHARRLISMLIYLCDHTENQMVGGELFLHSGPTAQSPDLPMRITPRQNLMVAFPCTARSYHSVSEITSMTGPRNYIQVHISSSIDIWPREATPWNWRRRLRSLKRRFK